MMTEPGLQEDPRERAHLRARAPCDRAAALLEETTRAATRTCDELRLTIRRLAAGLTELEREVLEVGERRGVEAANRIPKPPGRRVRERTDIDPSHFTVFKSRDDEDHEADEVTP